jgi:hypothetical protein
MLDLGCGPAEAACGKNRDLTGCFGYVTVTPTSVVIGVRHVCSFRLDPPVAYGAPH